MTADEILRQWNEQNNPAVKSANAEIDHKNAIIENSKSIEDVSEKEMEKDMPNGIVDTENPEQRKIREQAELIARLTAQLAEAQQQNNSGANAYPEVSFFDRYVE